jgi:hypothetical protein
MSKGCFQDRVNNLPVIIGDISDYGRCRQQGQDEGEQRGIEAQADPVCRVYIFHLIVPFIFGLASGF